MDANSIFVIVCLCGLVALGLLWLTMRSESGEDDDFFPYG
jgi:hypothetical protein